MYPINQLRKIYDNQQQLIILLSRLYFNRASREEVQEFVINNRINDERLISLLGTHGISAFIYHILDKYRISINDNFREILRERYLHNQMKCLEQAAIASRLQLSLQEKNITIIPYKGITFSYNYYGNIGLRESSDIDFLVKEDEAELIEQHLIEQGFKPKTTVPSAYKKYFRRNFKDLSYSAPALTKTTGYSVEMHWRLLNAHYGKYETFDFFAKGITRKKIAGLPFTSLTPHYDFLAVASNHFIKDLATRFKYIIDIACLLHTNGSEVNVAELKAIIRKHGFEKRMEHGLFLVDALLGLEIPGFEFQYSFSEKDLHNTLEHSLIKIKISSGAFMNRSLHLQDTNFHKIRFLLRCIYNYTLPMANDIPPGTSYPIPLLMIIRLYRSAAKLLHRSFRSRKPAAAGLF